MILWTYMQGHFTYELTYLVSLSIAQLLPRILIPVYCKVQASFMPALSVIYFCLFGECIIRNTYCLSVIWNIPHNCIILWIPHWLSRTWVIALYPLILKWFPKEKEKQRHWDYKRIGKNDSVEREKDYRHKYSFPFPLPIIMYWYHHVYAVNACTYTQASVPTTKGIEGPATRAVTESSPANASGRKLLEYQPVLWPAHPAVLLCMTVIPLWHQWLPPMFLLLTAFQYEERCQGQLVPASCWPPLPRQPMLKSPMT